MLGAAARAAAIKTSAQAHCIAGAHETTRARDRRHRRRASLDRAVPAVPQAARIGSERNVSMTVLRVVCFLLLSVGGRCVLAVNSGHARVT